MTRRASKAAAAALVGVLVVSACAGPFERYIANTVQPQPAVKVEPTVPVADLHADSLMWARDLVVDNSGRGHADLPRLARGGVVLQVFTVFTVTPSASARCLTPGFSGAQREGCADGDNLNLTALMQLFVHGRPAEAFSTRRTVERRALAFHDLVRRSQATDHPLLHVRTADDLRELVTQRRAGRPVIGAILGLEGAHPLEPSNVEAEVAWLHGLGYSLVGLVHRFDNAFAGSSEGVRAGPLTPAGEVLVRALSTRGMVVDAAHLSSTALQKVAAVAGRPIIYSHGGIATNCGAPGVATRSGEVEDCDRDRNLIAEDALAIARTGGVIGIGYWPEAVGSGGIKSVVAAMHAVVRALDAGGIVDPRRYLAIGSDFDGFVHTAVDAAGHPRVMAEVEASLGCGSARRIGWLNACRALSGALSGPDVDTKFCGDMP